LGSTLPSTAGRDLVNGFLGGDFDEVFVVYSEFIGMAKQVPVNKQLLPIPPIEKPEEETETEGPYLAEHICEPSTDELLGDLLPKASM
jgi:F-type H+-transporting ATPase subunit gamma